MKQVFATLSLVIVAASGLFSQHLNCTLRSKMTFPGQTLANVCGYARDEREYALVGASQGLIIVDITNPDTPRQIVQIPGPNNLWKEIKTYKQYAYIVSEGGQGVQIVSLKSLPAVPTQYHNYKGDGAIAGTLNKIHALHIDTTKGFLYAFGSNLFGGAPVVLDLNADPYNPRYAGVFSDLGYVHDGYADNDTLYSGHIYAGQFAIVNMADKAHPQLINTQTTPNQFTHNTWLSTDRRTLFTTDERANSFLAAYDVSNPLDIKLLDKIQSNPGSQSIVHNTHILGNFAVTSWYKDGFTIVDVSRPNNLVQVGNYDTYATSGSGFDGCWGVYPNFPSGNIIASNITAPGTNNGELFIVTPNYVRACFLEGTITNGATGQPLSGAKIELLNTTITENSLADGTFKMGQITGGQFTARVSKSGFQTFETQVFLENGALTLLNVALFAPGSLTLSGVVRRGIDQTPVPGAIVQLDSDAATLEATADASGFYVFNNVSPGIYDLSASATGEGAGAMFEQKLSATTKVDLFLFIDARHEACPDGSCFTIEQTTDYQAFPNPFAGETTLAVPPSEAGQPIVVFDLLGQRKQLSAVGSDGTARLGADWQPGVYFVRIGGQGRTLRVVKE